MLLFGSETAYVTQNENSIARYTPHEDAQFHGLKCVGRICEVHFDFKVF